MMKRRLRKLIAWVQHDLLHRFFCKQHHWWRPITEYRQDPYTGDYWRWEECTGFCDQSRIHYLNTDENWYPGIGLFKNS